MQNGFHSNQLSFNYYRTMIKLKENNQLDGFLSTQFKGDYLEMETE